MSESFRSVEAIRSTIPEKTSVEHVEDYKDYKHRISDFNDRINEVCVNMADSISEKITQFSNDNVNRPSHYTDGKIEVIDYIEDKKFGFCLGNAIKYISRAGKKHSAGMSKKEKEVEDLNKAIYYIQRRIKEIEESIC